MPRCHRIAASPGDLASGAWSHHFASIGDHGVRRAMDRTIARPLQCRGTRGSRGFAPPQWRVRDNPEAGALARLRNRLREPPPDGGLWSSRKVANWMAGELGLTSVAPQRGWEALKAIGWSIQKPRPKNPKSATPEEAAAFKKIVWPAPSASDFVEDAFVQSASTYPASGSCPGQDGDPRVPILIKLSASSAIF